jgi:hypothetical protein
MEQVSVNEDGTQSLVNIQCDNVSDLPSPNQTATAGYTIVRGSRATVLATSEKYILGGAGAWVKMEDGVKLDLTGYATKQYVDDGLADKVDTSVYSSGQAAQDAALDAAKIRFQDSGNIRLNQLSWSQTGGGTGMWIADAFVVTEFETVISAMITTFGAIRPTEITALWLYLPSSVAGMKTIRLVCDRDPTGLTSNPTIRIRAFGYGT